MSEIAVLVLPVLALLSLLVWIGAFVLRGPLRPGSRFLAPAFTALMIGGIAACVHGRPYAAGGGAAFLVVVLGVCLLVSAYSVQVASVLASWVLPIVWLVGAATRIEHCKCEVPREPLSRPAEHFGTLVFALFAASLAVHLLARRPARDELPRVRVLATRRTPADTCRPDSGN